ncbi:MAG: hypothetical protein NUV84_05565 [Candidatus Uhrbacteria bacterium]|nr:hypothetical protein [Candidatus Uhrbacteria bacterium]
MMINFEQHCYLLQNTHMSRRKEGFTTEAHASNVQSSTELGSSGPNDILENAGFSFFSSAIKLAREGGDNKRAHLLSQRERVISNRALNRDDAPFGADERRLLTGAMADALDTYITDRVQFEEEGWEGVENAEKIFRELGRELFGEVSSSVDVASTTLKRVLSFLDEFPETSSFGSLREILRMDIRFIDGNGGASKLARENPTDLKASLERSQLLLAQSLAGSIDIVEQMRMDGEMSAQEANKRFEDAYQVMKGLYMLQGLIDGLDKSVQAVIAVRENEVKVEIAKKKAEVAADHAEGGSRNASNDQQEKQENERRGSLIAGLLKFIVEKEAQDVKESKEHGSSLARQFGQFVDVFPQKYPSVSPGEAFRRIMEDIRTKKEEAKRTLKPEQMYAADAIALRIAVDKLFDEMLVQHPEVIHALEEAKNDESDRQRRLYKETGIGGIIMNLSPKRFLTTLYEEVSQKGIM